MPRLNVIDPKTAEGKARELFDGPLAGKHLNIFKGLANSPAALEAYLSLSGALKGGLLTDQEREIIALTLGQANRCDYCVAAHTHLGKLVGLSSDQMIAARRGDGDGDGKIDALVRFTARLNEKRGWVDDADLDAVRNAGYSDGHIAEIVANYALNTLTNTFNHVNDTEIDLPAPPAID